MDSAAIPISSFGIQQATACGEPRYFRLKKYLLIVFFILSFLGKVFVIIMAETVVEMTERTLDRKVVVQSSGQGGDSDDNSNPFVPEEESDREASETAVEGAIVTVGAAKTVIAFLIFLAILDLVFLFGIWTERAGIAKGIAIFTAVIAVLTFFGLLLGHGSFLNVLLTIGIAVLAALYWVDLKNMATIV